MPALPSSTCKPKEIMPLFETEFVIYKILQKIP
jgi:hypothetical protein